MRLFARSALVLLAICACSATAHAVALIVRATPAGSMVAIEGQILAAPATFDLKRAERHYRGDRWGIGECDYFCQQHTIGMYGFG